MSTFTENVSSRGAAEMVVAMAISGTIGWFVIVSGQPIIDVVFWRCAFGAATLLIACGARGLLKRTAMPRRQLALAALGGVAVVLNWLLLFAAYSRASIAIATMVYNMQPFMLVALGATLFGERPKATELVWLGVAFAGAVLLAWALPGAGEPGGTYQLGIGLALGSAFFYALAAIAAKMLKGLTPILIVLVQVIVGTMILAPFAHLGNLPVGMTAWASLATLGVVHTGLVFILLYGAIQKLPAHLVGALSFTYPLVAILVDVLAFGHNLQPTQIAGGSAVLFAAAGTTLGWSPWRGVATILPRRGPKA
jgi:drug/metabolite transporter (DMT)-like permease